MGQLNSLFYSLIFCYLVSDSTFLTKDAEKVCLQISAY